MNRVPVFPLVLLFAASAQATTVLATSPADVSFGLAIDWTVLGADSDVVSQPASAAMSAGIVAVVSLPSSTDLVRTNEGVTWFGDFSAGTPLIWTNWDPGPLRFDFSSPIQAFGFHVQPDFAGGSPPPAFTAMIEVFGAGGVSLGFVSVSGVSTQAEDGSALFVGFVSSATDVTRVDVSVVDELSIPVDFAIDSPAGAETVPEPRGGWLTAVGAGVFSLLHRSRGASQT